MQDYLQVQAARLDRAGPVPLYYQIKHQLKDAIDAKHLQPHTALPSERDLIELYGVSRPTVRQATDELLQEGYLYRKRGLGTFVAGPKLQQELPSALGFTERMLRDGRVPHSRVIRKGVMDAPAPIIRERLGLAPDSPVFFVQRLRLADGEPIMLETSHLPLITFPALPDADFTATSLYGFLAETYGFAVVRLRETLAPVVLGDYESKMLDVAKGSPAMQVHITAYAADNQPMEYSEALVRGDRCQYYLELETGKTGNNIGARLIHNNIELTYTIPQ